MDRLAAHCIRTCVLHVSQFGVVRISALCIGAMGQYLWVLGFLCAVCSVILPYNLNALCTAGPQ